MVAVDGSIGSGDVRRRSVSMSPKGKKRKLEEEDDHVEALRTKQFCDSSRPETVGSPHRSSFSKTSASQSSSSLLRAAATGGPAEGRGLRGVDAEVNTEVDECGSFKLPTIKSLTTPGEIGSKNPPNKMCIRHQSMADEGKTAKLQKVSNFEVVSYSNTRNSSQTWCPQWIQSRSFLPRFLEVLERIAIPKYTRSV